jgi:hypothetical protein
VQITFFDYYLKVWNLSTSPVTIYGLILTLDGTEIASAGGPFTIWPQPSPQPTLIGPFVLYQVPNDVSFYYYVGGPLYPDPTPIPFDIPSLQLNVVYVVNPTMDVSLVQLPGSVGGVSVPTNWTLTGSGLQLGLSLVAVPLATVAVALCVKRVKRREEKQ